MASRFACIATSRRRRALASSMSSATVRVRRASASLRRIGIAWRGQRFGDDQTSAQATGAVPRRLAPEPYPDHTSRR